METNEKFAMLDAAVKEAKLTEEEIRNWFKTRQTLSKEPTGVIKSVFPIAYKKGNNFEILSYLDLARKDDIWGYEIIPGIIRAKKCGTNGNIQNTTWDNVKAFAEQCKLNGKQGALPSKDVLAQNWSIELRNNIQIMDKFLCDNDVNAETNYSGLIWCSEAHSALSANYFDMDDGQVYWSLRDNNTAADCIVIAF